MICLPEMKICFKQRPSIGFWYSDHSGVVDGPQPAIQVALRLTSGADGLQADSIDSTDLNATL